jgi:hypothetical protein
MENVVDNDIGIENHITEEVTALWGEHVRVVGAKKATTAELRLLRAKLAEKLYEAKGLLCLPGRSGRWLGWLKEAGVPRSTADRLVTRHAETLGITENIPSEAINPQVEVEKLIKATVPRLRRVLTSPQMAYQYVLGVIKELDLPCETKDGGILLAQPSSEQKQTAEPELLLDGDGAAENFNEVPSEVASL